MSPSRLPIFLGPLDPCPTWCDEPAAHEAHEADPRDGSCVRIHWSRDSISAQGVRVRASRTVRVADDGSTTLSEPPGVFVMGMPEDESLTTTEVRRLADDMLAMADLAEIGVAE